MTQTTRQRQATAAPPPEDLVIRASAGAGKTYALSNRYLALLRGGAEPGHILATTFTRKAAGEILGRVLQRLAEAATDPAKAEELGTALRGGAMDLAEARDLLAKLGAALASVQVCTIDSFFNRMAMCFRYELGLPASPRLVDEGSPVARQLRRRAIEAMLSGDDIDLLVQLLRRLHHDQAKRRISDALDEMVVGLYDLYRQTDAAAWNRLAAPPTLDEPALAAALNRLRGAGEALPGDKRFAKAWRSDLEQATARDWRGFLKGGLAAGCQQTETTYCAKPIPPEVADAYHAVIVHARASIVAQAAHRTAAMRDLLDRFDAHYTPLRAEQRVLLFSDLPHLLTAAWNDAGATLEELYFRLDAQVQHLLLDEFQDTSPAQWRILRPFAEEIRAVSGGDADAEAQRSFFCVGDVKQSIYGWRGGCPEVFDAVVDDLHLPPDAVRTIAKSWRTSQVVLDVVNRVFAGLDTTSPLSGLVDPTQAWCAGFSGHVAARPELPGYVEMLATTPPEAPEETDDPDDPGAAHLWGVADHVAHLTQQHPGRSIGILARTNDTAAELIRLLHTLGVPASGEGGSKLHTDPAVEMVLSALTLADHPGHSAAAWHVLRGPLAAEVGLESLDPADCEAVARRIRRELIDQGYAAVIGRWTRRLADHCNRRSIDRLTQLVEMAEAYDPAVTLRVRDFVEHVRSCAVEEPAAAAVRVMTVHRAKGLEFDACVLCELDGLIGQVHKQLVWTLRPRPTDPPMGVYASVSGELRETLAAFDASIADAHAQELQRRVADDLSALYVAMTRPRYALYLLLKPLKRTKSGWSTIGLTNASPAAILRQQLLADATEPSEGVLLREGDPHWSASLPDPAPPPAERPASPPLQWPEASPRRSWAVVNPSALENGGAVDVDRVLQLGVRKAMQHGSDVHDQFAAIAWLDEGGEPGEAIAPLLEHAAVREALSRPSPQAEVWREQRFAVRHGGRILRGALDRVVVERDADGHATRAWLIDFKTDAPSDAAVNRYRPQLQAYRSAVAAMLQLTEAKVRASLLFVHQGEMVDV